MSTHILTKTVSNKPIHQIVEVHNGTAKIISTTSDWRDALKIKNGIGGKDEHK